ncbi:MAG: DivIVA domain-containing protein [Ilumatobacteraceae bacterium]|nr:DivIVA domain-containing protein [Ilumatobacteraceae bacterium]
MAISFSRPDPSSPAAVGSAQFTVTRRGFDTEEVRDFLRSVSAELGRLQERERFLESELRAMQTRGMSGPGVLDEETVTALLGEETARVLTVAREAAAQMRVRAAEAAERLVREANSDAIRVREDADIETARRRSDATSDVEAELELAKQQGREMVNEAREYREKVLSELARRRELARQQIEQLIHSRDRLVNAFDRARLAANDVVGDLAEFDDLSNEVAHATGITKPTNASSNDFVDHTQDPEAIPQKIVGAQVIDVVEEEIMEELVADDEIIEEVIIEEVIPEEVVETTITSIHEEQVGMSDHPSTDVPAVERMAEVVQLFGKKRREATITSVVAPTTTLEPEPIAKVETPKIVDVKPQTSKTPAKTPAKKSVDDLFASLRKTSTAEVARTAKPKTASPETTEPKAAVPKPKAVIPKVDGSVFVHRDEVLAPIIVTLTSKMKRVLADEENAMLTYLQGKKAAVALEKVLPEPSIHVQGYIEAVAEDVMSAAMGGAKSLSSSLKADLRRKVTSSAVMQVMSKNIDDVLVRPLRDRIQRCVEQSDGDREEMSKLIRSVYREWKMQRVEQHIGDIARLAFSRGAYLVLDQGTSVCWMVDPNGPPCADAEDNSLAGATALGADFPTGHSHPIAHTGCRCLVTPIGE